MRSEKSPCRSVKIDFFFQLALQDAKTGGAHCHVITGDIARSRARARVICVSLSSRAQVGEHDFLRSMCSGWLSETSASGGRSGNFWPGTGPRAECRSGTITVVLAFCSFYCLALGDHAKWVKGGNIKQL